MTKQVYTLGYAGAKPEELKALLDDLGAELFDIRFSPRSRAPQWNKNRLSMAIGPYRYHHCKSLGNANYKGGPVELVNFREGVEQIEKSDSPVVLMCVCKDPTHCHRTTVARQLIEMGYEVEELNQGGQPQLSASKPAV